MRGGEDIMLSGLMAEYAMEKANFKKLLIGSRMIQISYGETFNLLFSKEFSDKELKEIQMVFILDAPYWFGSIEEWKARIGEPKDVAIGEIEDCLFAYELARLKYNNLIQVENVEFLDDFLTVTFPDKNTLSIAYCSTSDYAWILEEVTSKMEQERMMICCQGNELFQNNIPTFLQ